MATGRRALPPALAFPLAIPDSGMPIPGPDLLIDRELSWLAFNHRVLQEAEDPTVPLYGRLGFLAIFSSNLDEFFRVRVAAMRALLRDQELEGERDGGALSARLARINETVVAHQRRFGEILRESLLPALADLGIQLSDGEALDAEERAGLDAVFESAVRPHLSPRLLCSVGAPFLRNRAIYLVVELEPAGAPDAVEYGIVEVPGGVAPRFLRVEREGGTRVWFLDDVVRMHLADLFPGHTPGEAYAVKTSRDAELYLDQEFTDDIAEAVRRSLGRRESGAPSRFLYDERMPAAMLDHLARCYDLADEDLVRGGRYHNLHDLHDFPRPASPGLADDRPPALPHPRLGGVDSILEAVAAEDHLLHFPYQSYEYLLRFVREAAADERVGEIWVTLYRVARDSEVVEALIRAAGAGKRVTAVVEVQARFDEDANLRWAERLTEAGVRTIYGVPGLKVHAKLVLVRAREGAGLPDLACLSTGNFNERTATVYTDHALLTARSELVREVRDLFRHLAGEIPPPTFEYLLVAPFHLREGLTSLVEEVAAAARAGERASVVLKMNSLEDPRMIDLLYRAGREGVEIQLVVRGICCLAAGERGVSERISARSIVDRHLEHARIFLFEAADDTRLYLASADWMSRNLDRRIEVAFPILDPGLLAELTAILDIQLADNVKARRLDAAMTNAYLRDGGPERRAQLEIRRFLQASANPEVEVPGALAPASAGEAP